jgi:hypothetical protein
MKKIISKKQVNSDIRESLLYEGGGLTASALKQLDNYGINGSEAGKSHYD